MKPAFLLLAALPLLPPQPELPVAFYRTYSYVAYTVYAPSENEPPSPAEGVGGTLTLRADGSYAKLLSLNVGDNGPRYFSQQGRFTTKGDSIFFNFIDKYGADVQRGSFRYTPQTNHLTIELAGYPAGNKGVYELAGLK